jgi:hypothetical protein
LIIWMMWLVVQGPFSKKCRSRRMHEGHCVLCKSHHFREIYCALTSTSSAHLWWPETSECITPRNNFLGHLWSRKFHLNFLGQYCLQFYSLHIGTSRR